MNGECAHPVNGQRVDYMKLTPEEARRSVTRIISSSTSEEQIRQRVRNELGYPNHFNLLVTITPFDQVALTVLIPSIKKNGGILTEDEKIITVTMYDPQGHALLFSSFS